MCKSCPVLCPLLFSFSFCSSHALDNTNVIPKTQHPKEGEKESFIIKFVVSVVVDSRRGDVVVCHPFDRML